MRWLIGTCLGLVLLWCLWWGGATLWMVWGVTGWFEDRRTEGWQAELADLDVGGFPTLIEVRLVSPELADPETGLAVDLDSLTLSARSVWPGDMTVLLPESPIGLATPQMRRSLLVDAGRADLNLHPGAALQLEHMSLTSGPFRAEDANGARLFGGEALILALTQGDIAARYELRFDVTSFAPGEQMRSSLMVPETWPLIFDSLAAQVTVEFDRPIDVRTLEERRPQPLEVDLRRIEAHWGDMRFLATGTLVRDANGFAEGDLTVKAENWQRMLDMATGSGLLPQDFRPQVEGVLRGLASGTGRTSDLDVTIRFEDGTAWIGFVPLGAAPSLVIR